MERPENHDSRPTVEKVLQVRFEGFYGSFTLAKGCREKNKQNDCNCHIKWDND
jgi:hypothetical protein